MARPAVADPPRRRQRHHSPTAGCLAAPPVYAAGRDCAGNRTDWRAAVDVAAPVLAARAAAEHFGEGGRIITVGSCFNGRVPGANFVLQATAKAALVGYTKALARELGPRGVNVTMVDPGPIDTDMNPADGESADFQRGLTAIGQYGHVDDIAGAVSFLAGPGGRFVTGAALTIDGGANA